MKESFKTIFQQSRPIEIKEKKSRFISTCFRCASKEEAEKLIKKEREERRDSTRLAFAYLLGEGEIRNFRYSDDGEPSGSAGLPIYNEILKKELFNLLVTVARYYGGIKLGVGGLARAYGASARAALESVETEIVTIKRSLALQIPFDLIGIVMGFIGKVEKSKIKSTTYQESGVTIAVEIPITAVKNFKADLTEKSGGKIKISDDF